MSDLKSVHDRMWNSGGYVDQAFTPDGAFTSEGGMAKWKLAQNVKVGDVITFVNSDKVPYTRAGVVKGVLSGGAVLALDIRNYKTNNYYWNNGTVPTTFEKDDYSLTFMDSPSLSGPSVYSCRSSLAVGEANSVIRRDSFAAGRQNVAEQDYCVALGRKAQALDYCSFVWSTQMGCKSSGPNTFTVGTYDRLSTAIGNSNPDARSLWVGDKDGNKIEMHEYMLSCVISKSTLLRETVKKVCDD